MKKFLLSVFAASAFVNANAQLDIGSGDPQFLATQVLPLGNSTISNVTYTGFAEAISHFSAHDVHSMPFSTGVLMTTGSKWYAQGANNKPNSGMNNATQGHSGLTTLAGDQTYNACVLDFDIVPDGDSILLRYIFASEEYPEFVGTPFKDLAAIYISGPGISGTANIAKVGSSGLPVLVNNVNGGNPDTGVAPTNFAYYVNNGTGASYPYNSSDTYLQYDGMTRPLTARCGVIPGQTYHLSIAIADVGDGIYDSALFLEAGSLVAGIAELTVGAGIFPNPATDRITIAAGGKIPAERFVLSDVSGKIAAEGDVNGETDIDISGMRSGIYFLQLISGGMRSVVKLEKL
jgi:hypothetical protein